MIRLLGQLTAFAYSTMHGLRDAAGLGPPFDRLPREEVTVTLEARNVPLAVAARISEKLAEARTRGLISDYARLELDRIVKELVDYLGGCEWILRTPLPFVYMVHLRRALILYCFTLPFPLVKSYHWFTIVIVLLLSYILFGIEEIGVEIENPFGDDSNDLSLEQYCGRIERDVAELLALPLGPSLPVSDSDSARPSGRIHG
jgi:putative membrane protein